MQQGIAQKATHGIAVPPDHHMPAPLAHKNQHATCQRQIVKARICLPTLIDGKPKAAAQGTVIGKGKGF